MPHVMIFCGNNRTRLGNITKLTPKPIIQIGNDPIAWSCYIFRRYPSVLRETCRSKPGRPYNVGVTIKTDLSAAIRNSAFGTAK